MDGFEQILFFQALQRINKTIPPGQRSFLQGFCNNLPLQWRM
jgi:hypothetical protein